jgi:hypothetical protein
MKYAPVFCIALAAALILPAVAEKSARKEKKHPVATAGDLVRESQAKKATIAGYLENEATFKEAREEKLGQAAGVLACLAQSLAEHPQKGDTPVSAVALRGAALAARDAKTLERARAALQQIEAALAGKAGKDPADVSYPWNKLVKMHPMMEEINARNGRIPRVLRRSRDPEKDALHGVTAAVLAEAMAADTHEVKDKSRIPEWEKLSHEYQAQMVLFAKAIKAKDSAKARAAFTAANTACDTCHEKFRDE